MRDQRLYLTSEELKAVELALYSFVINTCENPEKATDAQMETSPTPRRCCSTTSRGGSDGAGEARGRRVRRGQIHRQGAARNRNGDDPPIHNAGRDIALFRETPERRQG